MEPMKTAGSEGARFSLRSLFVYMSLSAVLAALGARIPRVGFLLVVSAVMIPVGCALVLIADRLKSTRSVLVESASVLAGSLGIFFIVLAAMLIVVTLLTGLAYLTAGS